VKGDPWWLDADPHRVAYVKQPLLGPSVPNFWVCNPAYEQVQNEHVWSAAWVDIMKDGVAPQAAAERADQGVDLRENIDQAAAAAFSARPTGRRLRWTF
jgi:hypothetical protein